MPEDSFEDQSRNSFDRGEPTSIGRKRTGERLDKTGGDDTHITFYDPQHDDVGSEIVLALAEVTGKDPTDLPRLAEDVDPEALDRLFAPCRGKNSRRGSVQFATGDYDISVHSDGEIAIRPRGRGT